jgi:aminoglycoside 3-N-acetyltransferase
LKKELRHLEKTLLKMPNFSKILRNIGLKKNDIVFVHSNLSNLSFKKNFFEICEDLYQSIIYIIGNESSLLVPTFTYQNFNDKRIFKNKETFSETGLFPEFIRLKKNSQRTNHPLYSLSGVGKNLDLIFKDINRNSTGKGSPFERMYKFDVKILHIDIQLVHACTFLHFVEEQMNVPYRYSKYYDYQIIDDNNKKIILDFENYVRMTEFYKFPKQSSYVQRDLIKNKVIKLNKIGKSFFSLVSSKKLYDFFSKKLKINPFYIYGKSLNKINR